MGSRHAVAAAAGAFGLGLALPVGYFVYRVGADAGAAGLGRELAAVLGDGATWRTVGFTLAQAGISAAAAVVAGLPAAYLLSQVRFPFRRLLQALTLIPFVLPSIIVVICMVSFWGRSGLVGKLTGLDAGAIYSFRGILVAHVFYNLSLAVRIVGEGWSSIDRRLHESAASLGSGGARAFLRVTAPLLAPSIASAFLLVFLYCFLSFGVVLVFGGARWETLEVGIYRAMYVRLDLARALALALVQLVLSMVFTAGASATTRRLQVLRFRGHRGGERPLQELPAASRVLLLVYGLVAAAFVLGPLGTMVARAFSPGGAPSLASFVTLFSPRPGARDVASILRSTPLAVVSTSLVTALSAGGLCFVVAAGVGLALGREASPAWDSLFQLPLGLSAVTLCIGADLLASDLLGPRFPRAPLVVLLQALIAFPVVWRVVRSAVGSLQSGYLESARSLGAGPAALLRDVKLPLLRRGLANAFAYGTAIAFADFTAAMTVGRGDVVTFPVAIYRLIGFRSFDLALALGVLYIALCALLFALIETTSERRP